MFWIAISSICIAVTHGGMLFQFQPTGKDPLSVPWIKDYQCVPTVRASTFPITAGDGEKVYEVFAVSRSTAPLTTGWEIEHKPSWFSHGEIKATDLEAEERECRSNPGYDDKFSNKTPIVDRMDHPTVTGWHCIDWATHEVPIMDAGICPMCPQTRTVRDNCIREKGYGSDGLVRWRKP